MQRIQDVKHAVLAQNGQLTFVKFGEKNIRLPLILNGQIDEDVLESLDKDKSWLLGEISAQGYTLGDVYIAEYSEDKVWVYPYVTKK